MIMQSPPAAPYMPPPPPRKRGLSMVTVSLLLAGLIIMCGLGIVVVGLMASAKTPEPLPPPASPVVSNTGSPSVHLSTAAPTKATAQPTAPARVTIPDGTWTIGEDYPAGKYAATGTDSVCYWETVRSGTNGQDLLSNGTGPGNLRVTLKAGQDFHSQNCGTWVKQ
jgi:hypothetical protein